MKLEARTFDQTAKAVHIMNDSVRERDPTWQALESFMYSMSFQHMDNSESTPSEIISDYDVPDFREDNAVSDFTGTQWRIYGDREQDKLCEWLNDHTMVCGQTDTAIIYQAF